MFMNTTRSASKRGAFLSACRRGRDHNSHTGADDALIEVMKTDDRSRLAMVVHAKDDADGIRLPFRLDVVELGVDDDGDPITTLHVVETDIQAVPEKAVPFSNNEKM
jgi:hypothetical protein